MSSVDKALKVARGFYPERLAESEGAVERTVLNAARHVRRLHRLLPGRFRDILTHVERHAERLRGMSAEELAWRVPPLRAKLRTQGFTPELVGQSFALVREAATLKLGQRHYDVQLIGGWILLNGMVAEMATGEGKTLAATLPACTAALAGLPVHIITVNDYLTQRDAQWMGPIYETLGLTVGVIHHAKSHEERREAYRCDVTYCTNKEIAFDYLRDRLELGRKPGQIRMRVERLSGQAGRVERLRLRGLCFAIVDEADSVLIDEARTPLIISGPGQTDYEVELYKQALTLSKALTADEDYTIDFAHRRVEFTETGRERLAEEARAIGGFWNGRLRREDLVRKALSARLLFQRDKHYVVREGQVSIVDEYTGRIMPGRSWEGGLHQLIQTKERCEISTQTEVLARISYQRFFKRYLALAGMTGTAREAGRELWSVYRLEVAPVPTHRPMIRRGLPMRLYATADEKWVAVARRIREVHESGRPVLVGTRTVVDSERLARVLHEHGLSVRVLNAIQDREEADIIAKAGQKGQITVATNMAGRGTDIELGPEVAELGGLQVIATERHDARRIDRQLFGRCGRQGDPGTFEAMISLEDELLSAHMNRLAGSLGRRLAAPSPGPRRWIGRLLFGLAQRSAERRHARMRRALMKLDRQLEDALAFSGAGE